MKKLNQMLFGIFAVVVLSFSVGGCSSGDSIEAMIKKKFPNETLLSEEEVKAEFGFIGNEECASNLFMDKSQRLYFIKDKENVVSGLTLFPDLYNGKSKDDHIKKFMEWDGELLKNTMKLIQERHPKCFKK